MDDIRKRLTDLQSRMAEILKTRNETNARERLQLEEENSAYTQKDAALRAELGVKLQEIQAAAVLKTQKIADWRKRHAAKVETANNRIRIRIDNRTRSRKGAWEQRKREGHELAGHKCDEQITALKVHCNAQLAQLQALGETADLIKRRVNLFASEHGLKLDQKEEFSEPLPENEAEATAELARRIGALEQQLGDTQLKLKRYIPPVIAYLFAMSLHGAAAAYLRTTMPGSPYIFIAGGTVIVSLAIVFSIYLSKKQRAYASAGELLRTVNGLITQIAAQKKPVNDRLEHGLIDLECAKLQHIVEVDEEVDRLAKESNKSATESIEKARAKRDRMIATLNQRLKSKTERVERDAAQETAATQANCKATLDQLSAEHTARVQTITETAKNEIDRLANEWGQRLADITAYGAQKIAALRDNHPAWQAMSHADWRLPAKYDEEVHLGDINLDLTRLIQERDQQGRFSIPAGATAALPLTLNYPLRGSLFVRTGTKKRDRGLRIISDAVLRLLASFPAGKAKLTIIDPVGLGQNFASLMHLADYDDSIVGGKIWSDVPHIERKLTELTEHMEKIIQKYLRNRYETIDEFNREAGQLAEPYRFLVIADFPAAFSELALERLASIIATGARCGVYTVILHDDRTKLPAPLVEAHLRRHGLFITEHNDNFAIDDEQLCRALISEPPAPPAPLVETIVNSIGRQCREAARVQVPFECAVPKPAEYWSETAHGGIRIPLGKAGADRLQYMHLGHGTAQHALIAGKTGSGKSNLFHTIVTNAALWYSPREIEFYLIDFKKGVEFKTYGVNQLPHARVIAIESDREFGLSVLRRIDRELTHRGEMFRRVRVQDYASFRNASPETHLPRSMLIIDEFQEFFVDDDIVAQDAALLLDRIVRQGRAFGIHVVLGSQTLGGTYTLSKSTLGQMAVRIALQCNESDSYLILGDDNSAASLLSRPGEAIYNDMSGLVEGNNPFQAVFLPKEVQEVYLRAVNKLAVDKGIKAPEAAAVFEGNSLADLRNNRVLTDLVQKTQPHETSARVWLGEANAIKGPTEVEFTRQAGSNLLIVGQRGDAEMAMCCAMLLSLAAGNGPQNARVVVLDGTIPETGARQRLEQLAETLPHQIEIVDFNRATQAVEELAATIKSRRDDGGHAECRTYLFILGLERFRALREEDEYNFSGDGPTSGAKSFCEVLTDGPGVGVHTVVWCDTLSNLNRTVSRKTLREFELRVLFQMSANNSSELIDTPAANRLGLYNALLFTATNGGVEKFRPYSLPTPEVLDEFCRAVVARCSPCGGSKIDAKAVV